MGGGGSAGRATAPENAIPRCRQSCVTGLTLRVGGTGWHPAALILLLSERWSVVPVAKGRQSFHSKN